MLIVKIMSGEDTLDSDARKTCDIYANVSRVSFERREAEGVLIAHLFAPGDDKDDPTYSLEPQGQVFVMNEAGRTISTHSPRRLIMADRG